MGIPVELEVRAVKGQYSLRVSKIVFRDTGMTDWVPLERKGPHALAITPMVDPATKAPVPLPKGVPPLFLQLHRADEIMDDYMVEAEAEGKPLSYHLRWNFIRTQKTPPGGP
jgi:hypothetical protein